jgi:two-component system response regulator VicR
MEQQGYNVLVAENGEYALDIIFKYKPDLILLNIMLPGIDGYDVWPL